MAFLSQLLRRFHAHKGRGKPLPYIGKITRNRVPRPSLNGLSQSSPPPNSATRLATIAKPSPVPCVFVVKNGCKIFSRTFSGMPGPSSSTVNKNPPSFALPPTLTWPPRASLPAHSPQGSKESRSPPPDLPRSL